jgi:hypothetical protein
MTLSTGEVPMEVKVSEDKGRKALAGQTVRMTDILAKCYRSSVSLVVTCHFGEKR